MVLNLNFFRKVVPPSKSFQKKKCIKKAWKSKLQEVALLLLRLPQLCHSKSSRSPGRFSPTRFRNTVSLRRPQDLSSAAERAARRHASSFEISKIHKISKHFTSSSPPICDILIQLSRHFQPKLLHDAVARS